jgi:Protein of unknown function (DUF3237)
MNPVAPTAPGLRHVFCVRAQIGAIGVGGPGPLGQRQHIPITGGEVTGPALQGRILPGGSDWALLRADGASLIDARYTIEAQDGTLIYVQSQGLRVSSAEVLARMRAGQPVDPSEVYFRGAPRFEAPEGPHGWLNRHLFVATLARETDGVHLQVFAVE